MSMHGLPDGITNPPARLPADAGESPETHKAPGTLVLVFVFLATFVLYYFVNWKLLSVVWRVG
ncbi:MAG TPA: hypothetical protein VNL18_16515 [Gemmatimonadales bacterium]|nr:hypothetical protein [Gemmatimonadales bacterium]